MTASNSQRNATLWADLFHNEVTAWVVLAVSLVITTLGAYIAQVYVDQRTTDRFQFEVTDARERIAKRMLEYEQVLRGGVALNTTNRELVSRQQWHDYVAALDIQTYFPGIQGIGVSLMLRPDEVATHEAALRKEGFSHYGIRPAGEREQYSAIVYLEPFDWRNQRAFGYDMYSEPVRRAAMAQARDSGQPAVSGRVILVQETEQDVQAGFLMYLPYYRHGLPLDTVEQRRQALIGYVYSPFRMKDLMRGILGSTTMDLGFTLYDGEGGLTTETLLYESDTETPAHQAKYRLTTPIPLNGRTWTAVFHSRPAFDTALDSNQPLLIGIGGLIVDIQLFTIIMSLAGERRRVQAKAEQMTAELRTSTERLRLAQEAAGIGTWDYNLADGSLVWDDRMCAIFGVARSDLNGTYDDWANRVHPADLAQASRELQLAINGVQGFNTEFRIVLPDGQIRTLEAHAVVLRNETSEAQHVIGINRDITDRARMEERLRLAASVFDHAHEGIIITDPNERILEVNRTFTELTGYSHDEAVGQTPRLLKSGRQSREFYVELWDKLKRDGFWRGEMWNRHKNGDEFAELINISTVRGAGGHVTHYVATFSDITIIKEQQQALERMALYDALTQLPNRVLLADRMTQAMARAHRGGKLLAVCYLDLDGFKPVNDHYGHEAGDQLLVQVAQRLNSHLREDDSVARLGGDEFVLLLGGITTIAECELALERLLHTIAATYTLADGHTLNISASIGVTLYPLDDADPDALLRHADQAMYQAKQGGRNRYYLFDPEHDRLTQEHREQLSRIEAALAAEEFVLHYQPKVDMRSGRVVGAEALIRWQHPEHGLLPPAQFLPVIEDTPFAIRLGEWVLRTALAQLAAWWAEGLELGISINISGNHLQNTGFAAHLASLLATYPDLPSEHIELEVLETAALQDIAQVSSIIAQCRKLGVTIAIDDFGTGYSSLTYLKRLPVDTLKIDQSFVRDMLADPEDFAIIEGIIGLTQAFRRRVVAEGVETDEHGALLLRLGCDLAQGYGIARPMPPGQLPAWVRDYRQHPAWSQAAHTRWLREDMPLLSAALEHNRWVDDLIASVDVASHTLPPPELDPHKCRFGQWYDGPGRERYGHLEAFQAIAELHAEAHALGREIFVRASLGKSQEASDLINELRTLRNTMRNRLHALQAAVE
ncbi:MAG: EAL domain-containing protein [Candidatus Zixiibacteriota bacterium]